jgi:large subunit ribosomal protein L31e
MVEPIYVINLGRLYWTGRRRRAPRAIKMIREFIKRHTKAEQVIIDESINEYIFGRAYDRPPRRIAVRVMKIDDQGRVVKAVLALQVKQ